MVFFITYSTVYIIYLKNENKILLHYFYDYKFNYVNVMNFFKYQFKSIYEYFFKVTVIVLE